MTWRYWFLWWGWFWLLPLAMLLNLYVYAKSYVLEMRDHVRDWWSARPAQAHQWARRSVPPCE